MERLSLAHAVELEVDLYASRVVERSKNPVPPDA
jgi:hypothetical protein